MDQELDQLVQAIVIASDPTQVSLHQQALQYISTIQQNAATTWKLALSLFVDQDGQGGRKYPASVRFFALRILDEFLDNRLEPLDKESFDILQQAFVAYIQSEYVYGPAEANSSFLRNKFSHTLTLLFLCTYIDQWPSFFSDLFTLIRAAESSQSSASASAFNRHVSLLFFHIIIEISDEVHDQALKAARGYDVARHERDSRVRDTVRERDASAINEAVVTIVSEGTKRKVSQEGKANEEVVEVVDLGIKAFASYVGWIDINLTVTPTTIQLLFTSLSDASIPIRLAAATALSRIVAKGLKEPTDKLQLIKVLSLAEVIDALEARTRSEQQARGEDVHEEEESYREALGRLLNVLGLELTKLIEEKSSLDVFSEATRLLDQILPLILRFLSDEYDDTCNTVFPVLQAILTNYKRARKGSNDPIDNSQREFMHSLLNVILEKLKWEEDCEFEDEDEEELAAFEGLRKDLRTFMDSVLSIDPSLVSSTVVSVASNTLSAYQSGNNVKWNEAELALYLVFIYGEINKGLSLSSVPLVILTKIAPYSGWQRSLCLLRRPSLCTSRQGPTQGSPMGKLPADSSW
jgi:exportin-T